RRTTRRCYCIWSQSHSTRQCASVRITGPKHPRLYKPPASRTSVPYLLCSGMYCRQ
ncbi:hypothetical protein FA95DRAFT_249781, partial [Auriscalpium vulgare]